MKTTGLKLWQAQFKHYLFSGANEAQLANAIADPTGVGAVTRLDVYRNAYYIRLQEALAHDFPALLAVLGDEAFGHQMANYLRSCPSTSPSLRQLGQPLSDWFRKSDKHALSDLAALEWAVLAAFDAADVSPLDADDLAMISPGHWNQLRFELQPALSLLQTQSNSHELWAAHRDKRAIPPVRSTTPQHLAIWRIPESPIIRLLSKQAFLSLNSLECGSTFGDICVRLTAQESVEDVPTVAAQLLLEFVSNGWITAVSSASPSKDNARRTTSPVNPLSRTSPDWR